MQTDESLGNELMHYLHTECPNMIEIESFNKDKKERMLDMLLSLFIDNIKSEFHLKASFTRSYDNDENIIIEIIYDENKSLDELIKMPMELLIIAHEICRVLIGLGVVFLKFRKNSIFGSLGLSFKTFPFIHLCWQNNLITTQEYNHFV